MYRKSVKKDRLPENGKRFQGGNLKGIRRRLDYIADMGVNAIWLSPVFKNRVELDDTYHGYGIQDFLELDPRFGTREELRELVKDAHSRGMYAILDIIINHTGITGLIRMTRNTSSGLRLRDLLISGSGDGRTLMKRCRKMMQSGLWNCSIRTTIAEEAGSGILLLPAGMKRS
ncbi:alpha-amylase family glycosyl hydrolase [Methanomethylovorans sp.]|uniref:alpha-amylase family glycosyl hydrolase n=1 Tax=Methanomethylovorans sp. TaxID=2758717 RepID=UPI00351BFEB0